MKKFFTKYRGWIILLLVIAAMVAVYYYTQKEECEDTTDTATILDRAVERYGLMQ